VTEFEKDLQRAKDRLLAEALQDLQEEIAEADVSPEDSRNGLYIVTCEEVALRRILTNLAKQLERL
jgi:hypothetical protein